MHSIRQGAALQAVPLPTAFTGETEERQDARLGWSDWLSRYFERFRPAFTPEMHAGLVAFHDLAVEIRARRAKLIFAGNGASASISAHGAVDFTKQAKVRAVDFNEPNLITAFSNDYGYENWVARALEAHADDGDAVVLISVSGRSPNIVRAAEHAHGRGLPVVTFTGMEAGNPLRALGDINLWLGSDAYNVVEAVHMLWLTTVVDMVVGRAEYAVS